MWSDDKAVECLRDERKGILRIYAAEVTLSEQLSLAFFLLLFSSLIHLLHVLGNLLESEALHPAVFALSLAAANEI